MRFTKMHGLGNDYIYIEGFTQAVPDDVDLNDFVIRVSDRRFGIGGDGVILVLPPDGKDPTAHARMRMFNIDGSEGEMCGNGIRCVCKMLIDHDLANANPLRIQTGAGTLTLDHHTDARGKVAQVAVQMGHPKLALPDVPVTESKLDAETRDGFYVNIGNPHVVFYVADLSDPARREELLARGRQLEHHPAFPDRMNVHFVQIHSPEEVTVLHWERGSGATLACGTGASAVGVAGVVTGKTGRSITAHLPGGDLQIDWPSDDAEVVMTGPAVEVFRGELKV